MEKKNGDGVEAHTSGIKVEDSEIKLECQEQKELLPLFLLLFVLFR